MIALKHHYLAAHNELMDFLKSNHQNIMSAVNEHIPTIMLAKGNKPEFIEPLDPVPNMQEIGTLI